MQEENWDQYKVKSTAPAATGGNEFDQYKVKKKAVSQPGGYGSQLGSQTFQPTREVYIPEVVTPAGKADYLQGQQKKLNNLDKAKQVYEAVQGTPLADVVNNLPVYKSEVRQGKKDSDPIGKSIDALGYIASGFNKGIKNIVSGAVQPLAQTGLIPGTTAPTMEAGIEEISKPFMPSEDQEENYSNKPFLSQLHALAEFIPASIGAAETGGATFFLNGYGSGLNEVKKMKQEGVEFKNGSDDVYALGRGLVDWMLMSKLNSHTIFSKFPQALRDNVVKKLSMEAIGDVAKTGEKATAEEVMNLFKKKALDFDTKLRQFGTNYVKSYAMTAVDLNALNAANYGLGKIANKVSGTEMFQQTPEDLLEGAKNILTLEAPIFASFGAVKGAGQLFRKSEYTNDVISSLYKNSSPENVDAIKQELAVNLESRGLSREEIQKSVQQVDKLANIAKTLPADGRLTEDQFKQGIELIDGREQLRGQLADLKASRETLDESVRDIPKPEEQLIQAKLEQSNDKLKELAAGGKYKYDFDPINDVYTKQINDSPAEQISKERFDLEGLEKAFVEETKISRKKAEADQKVSDFVDRINAGEDMTSPEDLDFYNKNKNEIDNAIQKTGEAAEAMPVEQINFLDAVDKGGVYVRDGEKGSFVIDGKTITFETKDKIFEIGNIDDLSKKNLIDFGIEKENPLNIDVNDNYNVNIDGKEYVNPYSNKDTELNSAINYDKNGNILSVTLETPNGVKRTFRGQLAQEIGYRYKFKQFEKNATAEQIERAIRKTDKIISSEKETGKSKPKTKTRVTEEPKVTTETPQEFISEKVSRLRAKEQAEYDAMDNPNDAVKRKEIYDRYDNPITQAIREAEQEAKTEKPSEPFKEVVIKPDVNAIPEETIPGLENEGEPLIFKSKKYQDAKEILETKGDIISDAKKAKLQEVKDMGDAELTKVIDTKTKALESTDTTKIPEEQKSTFDAMLKIDKSKLDSDQLIQLNEMIDKFNETGEIFDKRNTIEDLYKIQESATPETLNTIKENSLEVSRVVEAMKDYRIFSTKIQAVTSNEQAAAVIRVFTGMGEHNIRYGSMKGFEGAMDKTFRKFSDLLKKTKVDESYESQIKIGAVNDIVQHPVDMTPDQIQLEFQGRKKALADGIEEGKRQMAASKKYTRDNGDYIATLENVYNRFVKDANTPEALKKTLSNGEAQVRDFMLTSFGDMTDGLNNLSKIYKGKAFDQVDGYFPRMYVRPDVMNPKAGKAVKEVAGNLTDISDFASESPEMKLDKSRSTAFDERTLEQDMLPEEKLVNYSSLNVFQDNYRKQAYDLNTMKSRSYMSKVLNSPEFLEALNGDKDLLGYYQDAFIQRIQNEKSSLRRGDAGDLASDVIKFTRSTGNRIALGGIGTPYAKQFAPTMASLMINTGDTPQAMFSAIQNIAMNNKAFNEIINASPVSRRHKQEAQFLNGKINAKDVNNLGTTFRKKLKGWDEKMDKTFMTALKLGDQTSAGISYMTYYMKNTVERGKYKNFSDFDIKAEAKNPDPIAQQYAEQMTSTTLNVNEGVDRAAKQIGGGWLPFVSFAVNSKANLAINIGKLANFSGAISGRQKVQAGQRIAANVAEIFAINYISAWQRQLFIAGSGIALKALIGATSDEDNSTVKLQELVNKYTKQAIEKNNKNVNQYITQDILTGQIAGNYTDKMREDLLDVYGQASAALTGQEPTRSPRTFRKYEIFKLMGVYGIPIVNGLEGIVNLSKFAEPSSVYRQQKFGYIDPYDKIKIVEGKEDFKRPSWARYSQGAVGLANLLSLTGGSFAEVSAITRRLPQITGGMEKELYGNNKNLESRFIVDQKSPYGYTRLQDAHATIKADKVLYYLKPEQLKEWMSFKAEALSSFTKEDRAELIQQLREIGTKTPDKEADRIINETANSYARASILEKNIDEDGNILLDKKNEVKKK